METHKHRIIEYGHMDPFWDNSYKYVNFESRSLFTEPLLNLESDEREQVAKDFTHFDRIGTKYGCESLPDWIEIAKEKITETNGIKDLWGTIIKQLPKTMVGRHTDTSQYYVEYLRSIEMDTIASKIEKTWPLMQKLLFAGLQVPESLRTQESVYRTVIFLQNQQPGQHYLINDKEVNWVAGDYIIWQNYGLLVENCTSLFL